MSETKHEVKQTFRFMKDYRLAKKRGYDIQSLRDVILLKRLSYPPLNTASGRYDKRFDNITLL